jgi:hypothetical protein
VEEKQGGLTNIGAVIINGILKGFTRKKVRRTMEVVDIYKGFCCHCVF